MATMSDCPTLTTMSLPLGSLPTCGSIPLANIPTCGSIPLGTLPTCGSLPLGTLPTCDSMPSYNYLATMANKGAGTLTKCHSGIYLCITIHNRQGRF